MEKTNFDEVFDANDLDSDNYSDYNSIKDSVHIKLRNGGMKVMIITDTHFGARKVSRVFHEYFERFYTGHLLPCLDEQGIDTVIHMGDAFDSRKGIDFKALDWAKRVVFEPLKQRGITMHLMVGNHDAYYKNTNSINAVELLLEEYDNVITYSKATEVEVGGLPILFIPWINEENSESSFNLIQRSSCTCAMGSP